jgi:hypothetical protein
VEGHTNFYSLTNSTEVVELSLARHITLTSDCGSLCMVLVRDIQQKGMTVHITRRFLSHHPCLLNCPTCTVSCIVAHDEKGIAVVQCDLTVPAQVQLPRDQLSHFSHSIYKMSTYAYSIPGHKCWNAGTSWNDIYQDNNSRLASKWRSFWYLIALPEQVKMAQLERSKPGQAFDILTSDHGSLPQ